MSARRRMGPPPRMRPVPPVRPEHAGGLPMWERLAFAVVLAVMVVFVVVLTISAARAHERSPAGRPGAAGLPERAVGLPEQAVGTGPPGKPARARQRGLRGERDRRLAAALAPVRRARAGNLAVGVTDVSTGVTAVYGGRLDFRTASIAKVDILAGLLLESQRAGTPLSGADAELAAQMIETSSDDAATDLWTAIGSGGGLAAADARLGLRHTTPGPGQLCGQPRQRPDDQGRLAARSGPVGSQQHRRGRA